METSSDSDSQEEEKLKKYEEEIQRIKKKKERKLLRKKQRHESSTTPLSECNTSSTSQDQKDRFRTYKKLPGTRDQGREYEQLMCAFYAIKLLARDDVANFEMTTNNKEHGLFDDIGLKITFKDKQIRKYLFQLKHKEAAKPIRKDHLLNKKGDFGCEKYFNSMSSDIKTTEDVICILSTNSLIGIGEKTQISDNIILKKCDRLEYEDLLLNVGERKAEGEKQKASGIFHATQYLDNKTQMFYFFTGQNNVHDTKMKLQTMLHDLLQCNIYDAFINFMNEWWSNAFVLDQNDVIAKLTELVVSPYIKTLSHKKQNTKTDHLKEVIMKFPLTVVETDEDIIENIWPNENITDDEFSKTKAKFGLKITEQDKISWFLGKVPLVVKVDDLNRPTIKCVTKLMNKTIESKNIIFVGDVNKVGEFEEVEIFQNLSGLLNKCENDKHCCNILRTFEISLQGRESISLEQFISVDKKIAHLVGVGELLKMTQTTYIIGNEKVELPEFYIPRNVSTIFVKTEKILSLYQTRRIQTKVIFNCDPTFKDRLITNKQFHCVETSDFIGKEYNENENIILFSTKDKCTPVEFTRVCAKSKQLNVYLFQTFNDEFCILLSKKGNELPTDIIDESMKIPETNVLKHFDNPLNAICAPPGMGKSTLMKVFFNNCPSDYLGVYVDLINCNAFLAKKPNSKAMWNYFLGINETKDQSLEQQVRTILYNNKKMYLYLDGLDEVDTSYVDLVLNFIKEASISGINVWVSSRENLRETVSFSLHVVPIEIHELSKKQQKKYIFNKLEQKFETEKIAKISDAIFNSADLNNSQQLLGIPLQLHIITEMFLNNDDAYKKIEESNIFVLTQMYKLFFDGKMTSTLAKVVAETQTHLLGNIRVLLKQYEILALKACLDRNDFEKLNVNLKESEDFVNDIKTNGDKYGIIKKINDSGDATFNHQTYAEYFACVWLKDHKDRAILIKNIFFSERYENLRLMFEVMLAENNPLHLSIIYKNTEQFENFTNDANRKDQGGRTPLHLLCTYGMKYPINCIRHASYGEVPVKLNRELDWYVFMTTKLFKKQTDINDKDDIFNFDCIHYCLEAKCLYPIEILLEKKLLNFNDIKETTFEYYDAHTLAYYAAQMGYPNLFSAIIVENPQLVHARMQDENLLQTMVWRDNNKSTSTNSLENYRSIINILVANGFDIDAPCVNADSDLFTVHFDIDERLANKLTALEFASKEGDCVIVEILLECCASIKNHYPLHAALKDWAYNCDVIKLLIEKGVDINAQNERGTTALQLACAKGDYEITKMLLKYGALINHSDRFHKNALHYASQSWKDNRNVIELLINKGIDVNAQNEFGTTALHLACVTGVYDNLLMLLKYGALINHKDKINNNALHYASQSWKDNRNVIKLLIEKGIDVNAQNESGTTALQLACENGDYKMTEMLLKYGALKNT